MNSPRAILLSAGLLLGLLCPPKFPASESGGDHALPAHDEAIAGKVSSTDSPNLIEGAFGPPKLPSKEAVAAAKENAINKINKDLDLARNLRLNGQAALAEPDFVKLLADDNPETIRQTALLELALCAQDQNDLPRTQQTYAQFLSRWPNDGRTPEILLRQGQLFRQMGMNSVSLAKFYSVMTAALALKTDKLDYYKRLVMQAQSEIAETHFQMGKFADAADYFGRLLKANNPLLDRTHAQYRLLRSLAELGRHEEAVAQAQDFLTRFLEAPERSEVRFLLAHSLKELGRNNEALQQVLTLLKEQNKEATTRPEVWAYWQQRAGNEIANHLYREGDYPKALDIYLSLAQLDSTPAWQVPVHYQIGMTYEKLSQLQLATQTYSNILSRELTVGTNAAPGLKSVFEMARWRINFLEWQTRAESSAKELSCPPGTTAAPTDPKS